MIRTIKTLLGLAGREDATTDELVPSLPVAEAELTAARAAQAAAEEAFNGALLSLDDDAVAELDAACASALRRVKRAEAILLALRERLEEARDREAEAARVMEYQTVRAEADEARSTLREHYPAIAADLVNLLEIVARAEAKVRTVNADLPRGVEPLAPVEGSVRDRPAEPDELLNEVTVERWVEVGDTWPSTFRQENVYRTAPGRGVLKSPGQPINTGRQVELRPMTERTVRKGAGGLFSYPLASRIALPGLREGDADYWRPQDERAPPHEVVAEIMRRRHVPSASTPAPSAGFVVVELVPLPGAKPVERVDAVPPSQDGNGALEAAE